MSLQAGQFLTKCSFDKKENKLDYYRGKEHAMKIINYKEKKWCN